MMKIMKILESQGIQAYPAKIYSSENLVEIEWKMNNISICKGLLPEDIKYYEYKDGSVSFKTKSHNENAKTEEIISEEDE